MRVLINGLTFDSLIGWLYKRGPRQREEITGVCPGELYPALAPSFVHSSLLPGSHDVNFSALFSLFQL
jgi:hypothetical protein